MAQKSPESQPAIAAWHRNLLTVTAIVLVCLIAMGGILCMTQSIRDCPDWPGCFGKVIPPAETGPILEYTHRVLAALSALLILSVVVIGLIRVRRFLWISLPPVLALGLLLEVSYFGAQVVLRGLPAGWAAVDVGSALLVVALMITTAVIASEVSKTSRMVDHLRYTTPLARLFLGASLVVYIILVSGILVAGKNSVTGCLGWPIYSQQLLQMEAHTAGEVTRLVLSAMGIILLFSAFLIAWREKQNYPDIFPVVYWVGIAFLVEIVLQISILIFGHLTPLLVGYTIVMAAFWGLLITLTAKLGLPR